MELWTIYDRLNSTTTGRDSVFRLAQYTSRLVNAYLREDDADKDLANKFKNTEHAFSSARKFMRLGRIFETIDQALTSLSIPDVVVRTTTTFARINTALYYLSDHVIWLGRIGVSDVDDEKWGRLNNKFWFVTVVMTLTKNLHELRLSLLNDVVPSVKIYGAKLFASSYSTIAFRAILQNKRLSMDIVKNCCDLLMALTFLKRINLDAKMIGSLGVISSIITIILLFKRFL